MSINTSQLNAFLQMQQTMFIDPSKNDTFSLKISRVVDECEKRLKNVSLMKIQDVEKDCITILTDIQALLPEMNKEIKGTTVSKSQNDIIFRIQKILDGVAQCIVFIKTDSVTSTVFQQMLSISNIVKSKFEKPEEMLKFLSGKDSISNEIERRAKSVARKDYTLDALSGLVKEKQLIINAIRFVNVPNNSNKAAFIMLTGSPGNGKSRIAAAIANLFSNGNYYNLDTQTISSDTIGRAETDLLNIFTKFRKSRENMTFVMDECDLIFSESAPKHIQNLRILFQTQIEGLDPLPSNFMFVGMTNYYNKIPSAIQRRIDSKIYIPPPSSDELFEFFKTCLYVDKFQYPTNDVQIKILLSNFQTERSAFNTIDDNKPLDVDNRITFANIKSWVSSAKSLKFSKNLDYRTFDNRDYFTNSDLINPTGSSSVGALDMSKLFIVPDYEDFVNTLKSITITTIEEYNSFKENN